MNAYTDTMNKMFSQTDVFAAPMVKANQMAATNLEKVVEFQLTTMQKYASMGLDSIKAAASIDSPNALQDYISKQVESTNSLRQEMLNDFKAFNELSVSIREDIAKLAEANMKDIKSATTKATKKAA